MRNILISAATAFGLLVGAGPASALVFTLDFNEQTSVSSNTPATGASGSATFAFSDVSTGVVQLDLTVKNTTGLLPGGTFGAGATESRLTQFYFDETMGLALSSATLTGALDELEEDIAFQPFSNTVGNFSIGVCHQDGCQNGPPNSGLAANDSSMGVLTFSTTSTAATIARVLMNAWENGDANAALRFQAVNAGAGSDRLLYTGVNSNVGEVPLPATLPLLLGALGLMGVTLTRKRKA